MKYCPYCGTELSDDMTFCHACGKQQILTTNTSAANVTKMKKPAIVVTLVAVTCIIICLAVPLCSRLISSTTTSETSISTQESVDFDALSQSVLKLECYSKKGEPYCSGSAVVVFDSRTIVTNYHVISGDCYSIKVVSDDGQSADVETICAYNEENDLAILKLKTDTNITPFELGDSDNTSRGDNVIAIGSPLGLLNTVSTGIISGYYNDGSINALQITAPISSGSSGGALLDLSGKLIGITYSGVDNAENIGFAIPSNDISKLYKSGQSELTLESFYSTITHQLDLNYILSNIDHLDNIRIQTNGYVSTAVTYSKTDNQRIFIVPTADEVLGGDYSFGYDNNDWADDKFQNETERYSAGESADAENGLKGMHFMSGDYIIFSGIFSYDKGTDLISKQPYTDISVRIDKFY